MKNINFPLSNNSTQSNIRFAQAAPPNILCDVCDVSMCSVIFLVYTIWRKYFIFFPHFVSDVTRIQSSKSFDSKDVGDYYILVFTYLTTASDG
jgi:hypothetical protein